MGKRVAQPNQKATEMNLPLKPILAAAALSVTLGGSASAYSIFESDANDPSNDYGDVNGTCTNGETFNVRFQTDDRGRLYFTDLENQSTDLDVVIRRACGE